MAPHIAFGEQAFQVVEHQQHPLLPQVLQQEAEALFEGSLREIQWMLSEYLPGTPPRVIYRRELTQRAKDDNLEVDRHATHGAGDQR